MMKKNLLFIVMGIAMIQFANAQEIELIGQGVHGENPSTLIIPDPGTVDKVVVVAAATFLDSEVPADVMFSNFEESQTVEFNETSPTLTTSYVLSQITAGIWSFGYYTAEFNTVDATGITLENYGQEEYVRSFTAYIYRTDPGDGFYSEVKGDHAYAFHNGSDKPLEYTFTIPASVSPRDVVVTVPFTDLESNDLRPANVDVSAGGNTEAAEFETNNEGDLLHIEPLTLVDVPGDITEVTVTIYSQTPEEAGNDLGGDSFITGPILLTTTFEEGGGCTLTQGYWKTHSEYGPASKPDPTWDLIGPDTEFFWSGMSYIEVLNTSPKGNAYYNLAHQYIAARLNFLAGADNTDVMDEFNDATELFTSYTPDEIGDLKGNDATRKMFVELAEVLDDYNNGEIGPGHCDGMEETTELKSSVTMEAQVNPNPVKDNARVEFVPVVDGNAIVDLYDSMGNKKERLFNQNVRKDESVQLMLNVNQYKDGTYVLLFSNGSSQTSLKVKIGR